MKIDWKWLDTFNVTVFTGITVGGLWVGTFFFWGAALLISVWKKHPLPEGWLGTWLGGLTLYSGVKAFDQKAHRQTDYGAMERQAEIERAKAGLPKETVP